MPGLASGVLYEIDAAWALLVLGRGDLRVGSGGGRRRRPRRRAGERYQRPTKDRGLTCRPLRSTSKCTCGPVERPVDPMSATASPRFTIVPTLTSVRWLCA